MIYKSELPKVVGEFNADLTNRRIDEISARLIKPDGPSLERAFCEQYGGSQNNVHEGVGIRWGKSSRHQAFGSFYSDGHVSNIQTAYPKSANVDVWHADETEGKLFNLPEILVTASRWPTEFLIGRVAAKPSFLFRTNSNRFLWGTDEGQEVISAAIEAGDAWPYRFLPGEVLHVPSGTLHRRSIPPDAAGYRFFMRRFPRLPVVRSRTYISRARFF